MTGEAIAAILVAIGGMVTALCIQVRGVMGDKARRKVDRESVLLNGYTEMVVSLRTELLACQRASAEALEATRADARRNRDQIQAAHDREREIWRIDRAELKSEIVRLTERLDDLMSQVYVLQNPPEEHS